MKIHLSLLACVLCAGSITAQVSAQTMSKTDLGTLGSEQEVRRLIDVGVRNPQGQYLGQIKDLGIDLINGRIVEVLVVSHRFLGFGGKTVGVPPLALTSDGSGSIYRLNVSLATFEAAPAIDVSHWKDLGRGERIATAYRYFGQDPYFLEVGGSKLRKDGRPKVVLGYVERATKIMGLPVRSPAGVSFGAVWGTSLDVTRGRIRSVIVMAPDNRGTKSVLPAMALRFNDRRNGLVLDESITQYSDEPRMVYTASENGQSAYSEEQPYTGPHTTIALQQGSSPRDLNLTARIRKGIGASKVDARYVEFASFNGRVTLRGRVATQVDKDQIGDIAVGASRVELVDNQIVVDSDSSLSVR